MTAACNRLRIGGTVSGSTITGGTLIEAPGIAIAAWDGILGNPGRVGEDLRLIGKDGAHRLTKPYAPKVFSIALLARDRSAAGTITTVDGRRYEMESNLDDIAALLDGEGATAILERDVADGAGGTVTRFIEFEAVDATSPVVRGPIFGSTHSAYSFTQQVRAAYPFWQSETLHTQTLTQAGSPNAVANAGNARVANALLTFSGDSLLSHTDGATLEIDGSTANTFIDVGASTIQTGAGVAKDNLLEPPGAPYWLRLYPGANALTVTGANIDLSWRDHWL